GSDDAACRLLRSSVLVSIGTISYMFYLMHVFVIFSFRNLCANLWSSHWLLNRAFQVTGSFVVTLLTAAASWKWFERPILSLKSPFSPPHIAPPACTVTAEKS